jgi:hypothetical protein
MQFSFGPLPFHGEAHGTPMNQEVTGQLVGGNAIIMFL